MGRGPGGDPIGARSDRRGVLRLFGTTTAFDPATLTRLYPGGCPDYLARFAAALAETIAAGFVLDEDREEILSVAAASYPTSN